MYDKLNFEMLDFIFTISYNILHELVVLLLTDYAPTLVMVPNRALLFWKLIRLFVSNNETVESKL